MHTYFLSNGDVRRYGADLISRLGRLENSPQIWIALGISGQKMVDVLDSILDSRGLPLPETVLLGYNRSTDTLDFQHDEVTARRVLADAAAHQKPVLIVDSAIHSGRSMARTVEYLSNIGIRQIITFSLVMKNSSEFIPNFFGLVIGDHDRAFFQLDEIPIHRISHPQPLGVFRRLKQIDTERGFINTGVASIDHVSFSDLYYSTQTQNFSVFVYEIEGEFAGVLSVQIRAGRTLFVDLVARDKKFIKQKVGGMLMRWAETYARNHQCIWLELCAIESMVGFYERFQFKKSDAAPIELSRDERYHYMRRKLLYTLRPQHQVTLDYLDIR